MLYPLAEPDGQIPSNTNGKLGIRNEMDRIEKVYLFQAFSVKPHHKQLLKKHEAGEIERVDWLDSLVFREIEKIHKAEALSSKESYLYVDLQKIDFPLVHSEPVSPIIPLLSF